MNYKNIVILSMLFGFVLINTTSAASTDSIFDKENNTLIIKNRVTNTTLLTIQQVSVKPDLVTMEEIFKITAYEDYTFKKNKDFNLRSQKSKGKNSITNEKWEILETTKYDAIVPDFGIIEKNQTISNILSYTNVTDTYDIEPQIPDWGVNAKEKWNITYSNGKDIIKGIIGFDHYEIISTKPLNIKFFWYENKQIGSHQETRYRDTWEPFSPEGKTIKKNENYIVKLTLYKQAETGNFSIKTIMVFSGIEEDRMTWWNGSWNYRIDNPISNGIRPYQLTLNLSNSTSPNNNATYVFLNGHSNINFTDIRFTLDNTTALPYWIEDNETGKVWVNISTNGTVNLYYGNPSATDLSNGKNTFEFFDHFEPESWQKLQKLPKPTADGAGAVLNGKIYTLGGYNESYTKPSNLVWAYDPVSNSYLQSANLTSERWGPACTGFGANIYCFGGLGINQSGNLRAEKYYPANNTWVTLSYPPLPLQDQGLTAVAGGAYIYLFRNGSLYKYNPIDDSYILLSSTTPQNIINWPSMAFYNNEIYILGGYYSSHGMGYVQIYNITNNVWRTGASMPIGLYGTLRENSVINNKIYILQGQGIEGLGDFFSRYWVYNISTNSWSWGELGYWDADGVSGGVVGDKIYTFGGRRDAGANDRGTDFAGVLNTTKNIQGEWIDVITGSWRVDNSSLTNGLKQYYPQVQIRTLKQVVNTDKKIISRMKYMSGSSGFGGLIIQSNGDDYGSDNNGYLDPLINVTANKDVLYRETGSSFALLGNRNLASPDVWHIYISYYGSSSIRSTRDGADEIIASDGTYRGGYIQVIKSSDFKLFVDYIAVARYITPEPSWSTWSKEGASSGAPDITGFAPLSPVSDIVGASRTFSISVNQIANVIWLINGSQVQFNQSVSSATYTNTSAALGTWNVSAVAVNANGSAMQTWIWTVSSAAAAPRISFTDPTPANGTTLSQNYAFINTTVSDAATAFIDWNRSLAGWWRFNGESGETATSFTDWSSWGNNAACSGTNCPTSTTGMFGNALSFDGSDDYVTVPNSASLNPTSSITVETWFNAVPGGLTYQKSLIQKPYTSHTSPYYQYMLSLIDTATYPKEADFYITVNGALQFVEVNNLNYDYGQWHYLVGTYNGSIMALYLDGSLVATKAVSGTLSSYNTDLQFGAYPNLAKTSSYVFNGKIDEVRIHSRALSPEEIKASYNSGTYRLYNNFTNLAGGVYNYRAYAQSLGGVMNKTGTRILTVATSPSSGAPSITDFAPPSPVTDIVGASRTFSVSVSQIANVTWLINGSQVQFNQSVSSASYTNTSAALGTWNISAVAANANGSAMQTWIWTVSSAAAAPRISFTDPTPANGATLTQNYAIINTTVSDAATAFIDWNRSLAGWWRFNGESGETATSFTDWSSWGNNAACSGTNCPTSTTGMFGNALSFDGSDDYVTVPNSASLNPTSSITVETWFNAVPGGLTYQKSLIQKPYTSHTNPYYQYMLSLIDTATYPKEADFYITVNGALQFVEANNLNYGYGQWHYLVGTYNGSSIALYLDGSLVATKAVSGTLSSYNTALQFGAYPNLAKTSTYVFNGKIDEVRIHSRALSPEEIKASYNSGTYRLYNNFTNLPGGVYNYRAYAQNLLGNVNQTETRILTLT